MKHFDLINDYIEGRLSQDKEKELADAMNNSEELRQQMKQLLAVNSVVKHNKKLYSAPKDVRNDLFAALGVNISAAANPAPKANSITSLRRIIRDFRFGLTASTATVMCMLLGILAFGIITKDVSKKMVPESYIAAARIVNVDNKVSDPGKPDNAKQLHYTRMKYLNPVANKNENLPSPVLADMDFLNHKDDHFPPESDFKEFSPVDLNERSPAKQQRKLSTTTQNDVGIPVQIADNSAGGWSTEIRIAGNMAKNSGNSAITTLPDVDVTLGAYYSVNKNLQFGLEFSRDNYKFNTKGLISATSSGKNKLLNTFKACARYNFGPSGNFTPLIQVSAGLNNKGIAKGAMAGVKFAASDNLSLIAACEYNELDIYNKNLVSSSSKYGFNVGLTLDM